MKYLKFFLLLLLTACSTAPSEEINYITSDCRFDDPLKLDICLMHKQVNEDSGFKVSTFNDYCQIINNDNIRFHCSRMRYRPHMGTFSNLQNNDLEFDEKHWIKYIEAIDNNNKNLCPNEKPYKDECEFMVAQNKVFSKDYINLEKDCEEIDNPIWKSECYYLIADELILNNDLSDEIIGNVARLCDKSSDYADFDCFEHQMRNIDIYDSVQLCKHSTKFECSFFLGFHIAMNMTNSLLCDQLNQSEGTLCKEGYDVYNYALSGECADSDSAQDYYCRKLNTSDELFGATSLRYGIVHCKNHPYSDICFNSMGELFIFNSTMESAVDHCNLVPEEYYSDCELGIARQFQYQKHMLDNYAEKCALLKVHSEECIRLRNSDWNPY